MTSQIIQDENLTKLINHYSRQRRNKKYLSKLVKLSRSVQDPINLVPFLSDAIQCRNFVHVKIFSLALSNLDEEILLTIIRLYQDMYAVANKNNLLGLKDYHRVIITAICHLADKLDHWSLIRDEESILFVKND